ncbi:helix-turn-helix domain-containing protein [Roseomonas sp. HJA6]|uniref:Helix-turn-helix domain-containing protein n=1 Tax=Roseomonas alba TaxID=2846776 RepID=A0ABS7A5D3_9PROT|nr:helix-turn-helix domain-containing protein [Neoroseomonas alba]MBW6397499.1 helix-turn-helix domain-containing protein [Neoroseomonas alba]
MPNPSARNLPRVAVHDDTDPPAAPTLAVTVMEAVRITGLGRVTVLEAICDGRLQAVKAGPRVLVLMDSLRAFLASLPPVRSAS